MHIKTFAGGCDNTARVFDCRTPDPHQTWPINGEAERITWNPLKPFSFIVSTSAGSVQCFDCRKGKKTRSKQDVQKNLIIRLHTTKFLELLIRLPLKQLLPLI